MIVAPDIKDGESVNLLLDQKRRELLSMAGDSVELHHSSKCLEFNIAAVDMNTSESVDGAEMVKMVDAEIVAPTKKVASKMKKRVGRSMFPNMSAAVRAGNDINDLVHLQEKTNSGDPVVADKDKAHLGIFSLREDDMEKFISLEKSTLYTDGNIEGGSYISLWEGNVEEGLIKAAEANSLTDCLVNSASMLGYAEWTKYCRLYAQQLRAEGSIHKAVAYLLYTHDVDTSVLWLMENNLYREAICIVRSRDPTNTERILELYNNWAKQLRKDANYETGAKCLVALKEPLLALDLLRKRSDRDGTLRAIQFAMSSPDCADSLMDLCDQLTRECILSGDFQLIEKLCSPHTKLHPFLAWSLVYQSFSPVLDCGESTDFSTLGVVEYVRELLASHNIRLGDCRKQCSLSQQWMSPSQAKVAICERIISLAVDVTEGVVDVESGLVELYTMIMMLPKLPLYAESALTTAKVIHLLQFPGCDVAQRLTDCSFKDTRFLSDYALYICYLWSALIINTKSGSRYSTLIKTDADVSTVDNSSELSSTVCNGEKKPEANDILSAVQNNMHLLAFSLCHGLFIPWADRDAMSQFAVHLSDIKSVSSGECSETTSSIDLMKLVSFVDKVKLNEKLDNKVLKCILAMLLDLLRELYIYMCSHDDTGHLPNLPAGSKIIEEWVSLHTMCQEVNIGLDSSVASASSQNASKQVTE
ncbi:GEMIN5 [Bugula neritina]|uniref:GEMIN5 n=1 Tax=Bugula neritina TaxID=10212 RepID=A0A7J7K4E5_BUGNE|nr:GEMIN5 [Bugula neritina]